MNKSSTTGSRRRSAPRRLRQRSPPETSILQDASAFVTSKTAATTSAKTARSIVATENRLPAANKTSTTGSFDLVASSRHSWRHILLGLSLAASAGLVVVVLLAVGANVFLGRGKQRVASFSPKKQSFEGPCGSSSSSTTADKVTRMMMRMSQAP